MKWNGLPWIGPERNGLFQQGTSPETALFLVRKHQEEWIVGERNGSDGLGTERKGEERTGLDRKGMGN